MGNFLGITLGWIRTNTEIFMSALVYLKVYIFVQQEAWALWLSNIITHFKIKIIEKPDTVLLPDLWFLSCDKKF